MRNWMEKRIIETRLDGKNELNLELLCQVLQDFDNRLNDLDCRLEAIEREKKG